MELFRLNVKQVKSVIVSTINNALEQVNRAIK